MIEKKILEEIKEISWKSPEREVCGFIVYSEGEVFVKDCKNIHPDPLQFKIKSQDFLKIKNNYKLLYLFHSHINESSSLSESDKIKSNSLGLKFVVYSLRDDTFDFYEPSFHNNQYVGKNFNIGFSDCYSLLRDYYFNEFGINLNDYPRSQFWKSKTPDLMLSNFEKEGFFQIKEENIQKNDVILIGDPKTDVPCHILVYMGKNEILHHPMNGKSLIEVYSDKYRKVSKIFLRHVKFS